MNSYEAKDIRMTYKYNLLFHSGEIQELLEIGAD